MKNISISILIFLVSILHSVAQEQLIVRTVLNTSEGKALDGITVTINGTGNRVTKGAGFATFPNLKNSHAKTTGEAINLYVENVNYALVNHYDLRNYILPKDRSKPVEMILAKNEEKDKYIKQHLAYIGKISLEKDFDKKEGELNKQIEKYKKDSEKLAQDSHKERGWLMNKIDSLYKQLDFIQKKRVEKTNTSEQIAGILAQTSQPDSFLLNAYAYFIKGSFELAQKALNPSQIDLERLDYENEERLANAHATLAKQKKKNYIAKCLLKAKLYGLVPKIDSSEIWYEKAYQADTNYANTLFEYAYFLAKQNRAKRPAELYERALIIYEALAKDNPQQYLPDVASTLNNLGLFYKENNLKEQAQKALERALMIFESLAKDNPQQYLPDVAMTLNNLGIFYKDNNSKEQAQKAYERALMISESLANSNPQQYLPNVAMILHNLGIFYNDNNLKEQAQKAYERALMIRESLAKNNPKQYLPYVATTLNNLGSFYSDNNLNEQAQKALERALMIYESLAKDNPQQYLPDLAMILNNLGNFYRVNNLKKQPQESLERALQIRESLAKNNPQKYLPYVAMTLNNLGIFYRDNNSKEQAQKAYERALQIYESLAKDNPQQYLPDLAMILNNLGNFYSDNNLKEQAQKAYERALQIYESLAQANPSQFLPDVANTLNNLGNFYAQNNLKEQVQLALERALQIYEALAKANPDKYLSDVAMTLNNLGEFYRKNHLTDPAQKAYERSIQIYEGFSGLFKEKYLPYLAGTETNYALLLYEQQIAEKSDFYFVKGLKSYQNAATKLNNFQFWKEAKIIKDLLEKLTERNSSNQHKLSLQQAVIDFNSQYPLATNEEKALALGTGAWYALFCKEYKLAEDYARKGLVIAPEQHWLYTNLALALLLQNRWAEAKQIYQEKQNLIGNNEKPLKDSFLNDLIDLEKAGIRHPDFEKVRALLK